MKRVSRLSLLCVLLLAGSLCMAGCVQTQAGREAGNDTHGETPVMTAAITPLVTPVPLRTVQETGAGTCSQLGGDRCSDDEDCAGSWLDAADSFSCCSRPCSGTGGTVLTIVPFEPLPAYVEQESISP
jgi:predicted small secreted protein